MIRINLVAPERAAKAKPQAGPALPAGALQSYLLLALFAGGALAVLALASFTPSSHGEGNQPPACFKALFNASNSPAAYTQTGIRNKQLRIKFLEHSHAFAMRTSAIRAVE